MSVLLDTIFIFPVTIKTTQTGSGQLFFSQTLLNVGIHPTCLKFSQSRDRLGEYHPLPEPSSLSTQTNSRGKDVER